MICYKPQLLKSRPSGSPQWQPIIEGPVRHSHHVASATIASSVAVFNEPDPTSRSPICNTVINSQGVSPSLRLSSLCLIWTRFECMSRAAAGQDDDDDVQPNRSVWTSSIGLRSVMIRLELNLSRAEQRPVAATVLIPTFKELR